MPVASYASDMTSVLGTNHPLNEDVAMASLAGLQACFDKLENQESFSHIRGADNKRSKHIPHNSNVDNCNENPKNNSITRTVNVSPFGSPQQSPTLPEDSVSEVFSLKATIQTQCSSPTSVSFVEDSAFSPPSSSPEAVSLHASQSPQYEIQMHHTCSSSAASSIQSKPSMKTKPKIKKTKPKNIAGSALSKNIARVPPGNAARERSRVQTLRSAFLELQQALPAVPPNTKLSKLDVLVLATTYIGHLMKALEDGEPVQECVLPGAVWGQVPGASAIMSEGSGLRSGTNKGNFHPVKKWPMRTRLYAGIAASTTNPRTIGDCQSTLFFTDNNCQPHL